MEGTRNERAVVMVTTYMIGFVTAFIAFGLTQIETKETSTLASVVPENQQAAVANSIPEVKKEPIKESVYVGLKEDGLVYSVGDEEVLLSAYAGEEGPYENGFHLSIAHYELSPNEQFVYFCEVQVEDSKACIPFVYSAAKEVVYPLKSKGVGIAISNDENSIRWSEEGVVSVGDQLIDALPE